MRQLRFSGRSEERRGELRSFEFSSHTRKSFLGSLRKNGLCGSVTRHTHCTCDGTWSIWLRGAPPPLVSQPHPAPCSNCRNSRVSAPPPAALARGGFEPRPGAARDRAIGRRHAPGAGGRPRRVRARRSSPLSCAAVQSEERLRSCDCACVCTLARGIVCGVRVLKLKLPSWCKGTTRRGECVEGV